MELSTKRGKTWTRLETGQGIALSVTLDGAHLDFDFSTRSGLDGLVHFPDDTKGNIHVDSSDVAELNIEEGDGEVYSLNPDQFLYLLRVLVEAGEQELTVLQEAASQAHTGGAS